MSGFEAEEHGELGGQVNVADDLKQGGVQSCEGVEADV